MATFAVTVTSNTTPAISASMTGTTTYAQFKNSLGQFVYDVNNLYTFSSNQTQISNVYNYSKYDTNGDQDIQSVVPTIDPYQTVSSLFINTKGKSLVIDGRDYLRFNMQPNTSLSMKFYAERISNQEGLSGKNNFKELEYQSDNFDFFEEYNDQI
jgi:hypothetical protein